MSSPRISNQESGLDTIEGSVVGLPVLLHHRIYSHNGDTLFNYNTSVSGFGSAQALSNEVRAGLLQRQTRTALLRRRSRSSTNFKRRNSFWGQDDMNDGQVLVLPLTPLNHSCLQLRGQVKQIHYSKPNTGPTLDLQDKHRRQSSGGQCALRKQVDGDIQTQRSLSYMVDAFNSVAQYQPPRVRPRPIHTKSRATSPSDSESQNTDSTVGLLLAHKNTCKVVPYRLQSFYSKQSNKAMADIKKSESSSTRPACHHTHIDLGFDGKTEYTHDEGTLTLSVFLPSEGITNDSHISAEDTKHHELI